MPALTGENTAEEKVVVYTTTNLNTKAFQQRALFIIHGPTDTHLQIGSAML